MTEKVHQGRSCTAGGRVIHQNIDVTMKPPYCESLGHTDAAMALGKELLSAAVTGLCVAAEAEGFVVEVEAIQVVY